VAIKTLKKKQYEDVCMPYPPRELDLLKKLCHPHIARLLHSISTDSATFLVMELVSGGELFDYVAQQGHLSEEECRGLMRQIVRRVLRFLCNIADTKSLSPLPLQTFPSSFNCQACATKKKKTFPHRYCVLLFSY
jgi:serine/threonine protein kinase